MLTNKFLNIPRIISKLSAKIFKDCSCQNGIVTTASISNNQGDQSSDVFQIDPRLEKSINKQITRELTAFYSYMALGEYFEQKNMGLKGFASRQRSHQQEELKHAAVLQRLLRVRGGSFTFEPIPAPETSNWNSAVEAIAAAFKLEQATAAGLKELLKVAEDVKDSHVIATIETHLMEEQMECLHEAAVLLSKLEKCSSPECVLIIDEAFNKD